ncbi:unnamed protein product [Penicillium nalgiovense]|uniref:Uncharacterized protein n=1 Tax=Penicillium nalgiovense TaxID=60175 RepID=A0A9W4N9L6_PENNA|nr:unnamed protein product [Penicillium nalgiovense]CAG7941443.1 unnamed protein product [Penicillium nalgiovense]CAG7944466.1 unnamed protein product [Penicillium nalgiovense]CAG7946135.1 unnamed protein product [Penicillium nalgiovense]CAG7978267.1 unnamed protein product [Penicillium nalgiovense]
MVTRSRGSSFPGLAFSISLPFLVRPRQFFILVTLSTSLSQSFTMESSETTRSLLQRPESSGIDIIDFSFGKPSSHKPSYSRNLTKQSTIPHPAVDNPQSSREHVGEGAGRNHQAPRPDTPLNLRSVGKEGIPKAPIPMRQPVFPQPPRRLPAAAEPSKDSGSRPTSVDPGPPSFGREQATIASQPNEPTRADTPRETISPAGRAVDPSQERVADIEKTGEVNSALPEPTQEQHLHRERQDIPENPCSRVSLKPIHNQLQPSKRRRAPEKDHSKQHASLVGGKNGVQLSEDDLFELLITKMRQREESEQAAADIQRQVTNENVALKEENLNLQDRLKKCQAQLAKTSSESRSQRAQIDKWKVKLGTFKGVLNELGREYGAVREQAKELKEATMSLDREKSEIQHSLEDIRLKVSGSAETIQDQRERLSISDGTVASLREALDHSEKRGDLIKTQLSNEKKRIMTLETYIQNESQSQSRYLALVRNDQRKMAEKLGSACELFNTSFTKSQDNILSKLSPMIESCLILVQGLKEQCSAETMNVQDFTNSVHEATSRFNSLTGQVTSDVERSTETSKNVFQALQEALQAIEGYLGPHSSISKQLANSESCYGNLQQQLQIVGPMLDSLGGSIKAVGITETDLVHGLETFGQKLSEARIPAGNPVLEMEISNKFAENTKLQLQLQEMSTEVESLRKQLANRSSENQHLQHALTETVANEQVSKSQTARLEIEKTALRGELQLLEQRVREELGAASTKLQDQMKAEFEEQVQGLETEKRKLETDINNLQAELANVRSSLLEESQRRIMELNVACSNYIAEAKALEAESNVLKGSEAGLLSEKERLLEQLEKGKRNSMELEANLGLKTESVALKEKAIQEAEKRVEVLELETAQKTEELAAMEENLGMLKSRSSALEKVGEETDAEIISLLRRAQEAESWQATIREGFAKVIDVHPDESFEQTWQKLEDIIQSSLAQPPMTGDTSSTKPHGTVYMEGTKCSNVLPDPRETKHENIFEANDSNKGTLETAGNVQTDGPLAPKIRSPPKSLKRGDCVDSRPKFAASHAHIVPFSSLHDRLSRENSLSVFNDPAELEMLFMSTPDLRGALAPVDASKKAQEHKKILAEPLEMSGELSEPNPAFGMQRPSADNNKSERSQLALEQIDGSFVDKCAKNEQPNTKRKVVSFEGAHVITQTELGRTRRMSDATDNSSGRESESKEVKRTQQRTYSRLRQSVAQEETSIETTTEMQPANKALVGKSLQGPMDRTDQSSNPNPRPPKRPRNAADGPERRLSPKGLASGSSRANTAGQPNSMRGRGKRRTRDRYNQRFSQDAG